MHSLQARGEGIDDPVVVASFRSSDEAMRAGRSVAAERIEVEVEARSDRCERLCLDVFRGGYDVIVSRAESDRAIVIVQALWPDGDAQPHPTTCRACRSANVVSLPRVRIFLAVAALLLVGNLVTGQRDLFLLLTGIVAALLAFAPNLHCRDCGERWRGKWTAPFVSVPADSTARPSCPRCNSAESSPIARRREKATTLLVNFIVPPLLFVWPFLARWRCDDCGHQWR